MQLWKCFTISPLRSACLVMHQTTMKAKGRQLQRACKTRCCRVRQLWELGVRFWLFGPHWISCQKIKMMQCALFCCYFWKQKIATWCFPLVDITTSPDRTERSFSGGQGRNEGDQRGAIPRAPNRCGGRKKVPTMSQVLSSIQYICFRKTSGANMGAPNLLLAQGAI